MNVRGKTTLVVSLTRLVEAIGFRTGTRTNEVSRKVSSHSLKPYNKVYRDFPSPVQANNWDLVWVHARRDSIR